MTDACRLCGSSSETIQRLIASRPKPAQNTYKHRHYQVAKFLPSVLPHVQNQPKILINTNMTRWPNFFHQELAKHLHLLKKPYSPYYKYEPQVVLENDNYKLYCGLNLSTDKTFVFNRLDTTLVANTKKGAALFTLFISVH